MKYEIGQKWSAYQKISKKIFKNSLYSYVHWGWRSWFLANKTLNFGAIFIIFCVRPFGYAHIFNKIMIKYTCF